LTDFFGWWGGLGEAGVNIDKKMLYLCGVMKPEERLKIEEKVIALLRTVFDPEIPVDIYSLGLIYRIEIDDDANLEIDMTLTAPNCPAADFILEDARIKLESIEELKSVNINLVFEPEWDKDMMSEEAKLELGFL
jgi:FeS assembly SUF system protein